MPTITYSGGTVISSAEAGNDDVIVDLHQNGSLEFVVAPGTTAFSYSLDPLAPGQDPETQTISFNINALEIRMNGEVVDLNDPSLEPQIVTATWLDGNNILRTTTLFAIETAGLVDDLVLGQVRIDSLFVIGGTPLPTFNSIADFTNFDENQLQSISFTSATFPADTPISFASTSASITNSIIGNNNDNTLQGTSGDDTLEGLGGDDTLNGKAGNDRLFGGDGSDRLLGGAGNDLLNTGENDSEDFVQAGKGNDTVDMSGIKDGYVTLWHQDLNRAITVNIDGNANTGTINKGANGTTTLVDVANPMIAGNTAPFIGGLGVYGTTRNDTFNITVVDGGWMQVGGLEGRDTYNISPSTGFIRLDLRQGNPTQGVIANLSNGVIKNDGFGTRDTVNGRVNELRTTMNDDTVIGSDLDDRFILMAGNDTLNGGDGDDTVRYDRSGVQSGVTVDLSAGTATGTWSGQAFIHTLRNIENVRGSRDHDDVITGSTADNRLQGRGGNDTLIGLGGNDRLEGENGDDTLNGGSGNDQLYGGSGNDQLLGGNGDDYINTGDNTWEDFVQAGKGNDTVDMSGINAGYVTLWHHDLNRAITVNIDGTTNTGSIDKGANGFTSLIDVDNPMLSANISPFIGGLGVYGTSKNDTFNVTVANGGWMQIGGMEGRDTYNIGASTGTVRLDLRQGNPTQGVEANLSTGVIKNDGFGTRDTVNGRVDELRTTMNDDTVIGSDLDDRFILMAGNDTLNGRGGTDTVRYDRSGVLDGVTVDLQAGTATGTWSGQAFSHTLLNIENVRGSRDHDDVLRGSNADNRLQGRGGDDTLIGRSGNDRLEGEDGRDTLNGGSGNDILIGGAGRDTFIYNAGADIITDFGTGNDRLRLDDKLWAGTLTKAQVLAFASHDGTDTTFDFGNGNTLVLENYTDIAGLEAVLTII